MIQGVGTIWTFLLLFVAALMIAPANAAESGTSVEWTPRQLASIEAGRRAFVRCVACHSVDADAKPTLGPHLEGIVGRRAASVPGFAYSADLKDETFVWTRKRLLRWLEKPQQDFPKLCIPFTGLSRKADREALVAYLEHPNP